MLITERERIELVKKLEEAMGERAAAALMEYLPANGWREVATVTDLDNLRLELKGEMTGLRGELHSEITELRGELHSEVAGIRAELSSLKADLVLQMLQQTRAIVIAFVTALIAFGGLLVAAAAIFKR